MCKEQLIKQWENSNLQWGFVLKFLLLSLSYICQVQTAQRMPSPDSISRGKTQSVWSEMAVSASRSYWYKWDLGSSATSTWPSFSWMIFLSLRWFRGWGEARSYLKPELPKLFTHEVSSLWYLQYLFWNQRWILKLPISSDHLTHFTTTLCFHPAWDSLSSSTSFTHLATLLARYLINWLWFWCLLTSF